jgi:hypothetical protein
MAKKKTGTLKDPFGCEFPKGYTIDEPHGEATTEIPVYTTTPAPLELSQKGKAYVDLYHGFKSTAKCPRCGERRFQNLYDIGAGYGPPGCQIGICAPCGEDLKLARPKRKRLATWEGK